MFRIALALSLFALPTMAHAQDEEDPQASVADGMEEGGPQMSVAPLADGMEEGGPQMTIAPVLTTPAPATKLDKLKLSPLPGVKATVEDTPVPDPK